MPKVPKLDKTKEDDDDYEIVSFEDFCDKSPSSKTDLLTLNDNINYRLFFESDKTTKFDEGEGSRSANTNRQSETSLSGAKNVTFKRKLSGSFAPFGRATGKATTKGSLFGGVIPKTSNGEPNAREHRYQRFSADRNIFRRIWESMPVLGSSMVGVLLVCVLCVVVWLAVSGAVGGAWGEEHYRRLWERAHPDSIKKPLSLSPIPFDRVKVKEEEKKIPTEPLVPRYHDHSNLSNKNRNATETFRSKELDKKSPTAQELQAICSNVPDEERFDCYPDGHQDGCEKRGCCWNPAKSDGPPWCFYPPNYTVYKFTNMTESKRGIKVLYHLEQPAGYPEEFEYVAINFKYYHGSILNIIIQNGLNDSSNMPTPELPVVPGPIDNLLYRVEIDTTSTGFKVIRTSDNVTIMNSNVGAMIMSSRFQQISWSVNADHVYGLGEKVNRFMNDMRWQTHTLWNADRAPVPVQNGHLYGSHPFYLAVEQSGKSHGVLNYNNYAMDVVLQPTPAITWRTLGGYHFFLVYLGPWPSDVTSQHVMATALPVLPPYWALGFQLCKFGYNSLANLRHVWKTNRDAGLPFDVQWTDIDAMDNRKDFTYDEKNFAGLPQFVDELHKNGMHYVPMFDPGVSATEKPGSYPPYDRGLQMDIFVKNSTNQTFLGKVWSGANAFPDWSNPQVGQYWTEMFADFHKKIKFDGAWIDMNEPSNFVNGQLNGNCAPLDLPYKPKYVNTLDEKTLCMDARHHLGAHYDVHNLLSLWQARWTYKALREIRGKRPFIISRSTTTRSGGFAGHWTGDIRSSWEDMRYTIPSILSFGLYGIPLVGSDICGFTGNTTVELCKRWMQLGAFYPFARNHAETESIPQDPSSLGPEVLGASIKALRLRYRLLPHYYSLFWIASLHGHAVLRPLFFEWPEDTNLHPIDDQFLIGRYVMVTPILQENANTTRAIFPGPERWYNIRDGSYLATNEERDVDDDQMVSIRGGAILPLQEPPLSGAVTTANCRPRPLQLLVVPDNTRVAKGNLYWDDGDSLYSYREQRFSHIKFESKDNELLIKAKWWGYGVPNVNNITVLNQQSPIKSVLINGTACVKPRCLFEQHDAVLNIFSLSLPLDKPTRIKWVS